MTRTYNSWAVCLIVALALVFFAACRAEPSWAATLPYPDHPRFTSQRFGEQFGIGVVTATALAQDHEGFLWIGTQTGLFRYDGSRVTRMSEVEPLVGHYINAILIGPDGSVWISGFHGVARYHGDQFVPLILATGAGSPAIAAQNIAVDSRGTAYVAVRNGIVRTSTQGSSKMRLFGKKDGLDCVTEALVTAPDDSVWFNCGQRLGHFAPGATRPEWEPNLQLPKDRIVGLIFDRAGNLWMRSSRHVARIDRVHHNLVADDAGIAPSNEEGGQPVLDNDGDLLVPSMQGLFWRDNGHWRVINDKDGLSSNNVQVALQDAEGTLWVGGYGTGLDHLTGIRDWSAWTQAEGLPDNSIWATLRDHESRLWVATPKGIGIWDGQAHRWKILTDRNGLSATETRQLELARDGSVWAIALPGGITRIDPATFNTTRFTSFQGESFIFEKSDPTGDIWATTGKHLLRFDGGSRAPAPLAVQLPEQLAGEVRYLDFSPAGVLWACGGGRLLRFDGHSWRQFGRQDGLLGDTVTSLAAVSGNEIWLGYDDVVGITQIQLGASGTAHPSQFPWDLSIIGKDSKRRIWLNGIDGIRVFSPDGTSQHLTEADGLVWDDISPFGFREEGDGSFLIATTRGLARYVEHSSAPATAPPRVVITSVSLGDQYESTASRPQVDYRHGSFYAQFTPLNLSNSAGISCRYRLAGLDESYAESSLREVRYSSLAPGHYEFAVQCRNELSGWSPQPARFSFIILPPWWQTMWFRGVSAIAALFLVWGIVRIRTHSLHRRRRQLEEAVAQRSAELLQKNRELEEISLTDPLTRARNRRYFYETIPADAAHVLRQYRNLTAGERPQGVEHELVFAMVDIDYFKVANDEHGHMAGDRLIQEIANRLSSLIRKSDVLVRWGGEEFLIVCRSTDRAHATLFSSRILEAISGAPYHLGNGATVNLTCSVGWAPFPWVPEAVDALTLEQVIELADRALYLAKKTGRNQGIGLLPSAEAMRAPYDLILENLRNGEPTAATVIHTPNPLAGSESLSRAQTASSGGAPSAGH